jgi:AcrR family transcriptional regulator
MGGAAHGPERVVELAPRRGRPRSVAIDARIVDATIDELGEVGYARLSMEGVARRAGVARTTIYRRWPSKLELVCEVIEALSRRVEVELTGDTARDLESLMRAAVDALVVQPGGRALVAVVVDGVHNPQLTEVFRTHNEHHEAVARSILEHGMATGQLRDDVDVEIVIDQLGGMIPYRMIVSGKPVPIDLARRSVAAVLRGIRP